MYQMSKTLTKRASKGLFGLAGKQFGGGGVKSLLHGSAGKMATLEFNASRLIKVIQAGLLVRELKDLQESLAVPMERLVPMLGISKSTLHRRIACGRLGPAESDRVVRFARLMGKAVEVMASEESGRRWLTSPQFGLGGAVAL